MSIYMTDERRMFQASARQFTQEQALPVANELDPVQGDIPRALIEQMGELGFFGITISKRTAGWVGGVRVLPRGGGVPG